MSKYIVDICDIIWYFYKYAIDETVRRNAALCSEMCEQVVLRLFRTLEKVRFSF